MSTKLRPDSLYGGNKLFSPIHRRATLFRMCLLQQHDLHNCSMDDKLAYAVPSNRCELFWLHRMDFAKYNRKCARFERMLPIANLWNYKIFHYISVHIGISFNLPELSVLLSLFWIFREYSKMSQSHTHRVLFHHMQCEKN